MYKFVAVRSLRMFCVIAKMGKQVNTHMLSGKNENASLLWAVSFTIFLIIIILSGLFTPTLLFSSAATTNL